jgi:protein-disulfide isomerase
LLKNMAEQKNIPIDKELYLPASVLLAALIISGTMVYTSGGVSERARAGIVNPTPAPVANNGKVDFTITENDHIRGNPDAQITLVEFSDLQCPFCKQFHPTVQRAMQEYGDSIRWVYKHYPLDQGLNPLHPQARPAAEASECVWEQEGEEGFWDFVDAVFDQQERLGSAFYREVAQQIGINLAQFDTCVAERKYQDKVEQDYQQGVQAGVTGTPGSFVNGIPVKGALPYDENSPGYRPGFPTLTSVIDSQL